MSSLKLVINNDRVKAKVKPGSAFPIEKRAVIEDGIPTIRRWKNGSPFITDKEENQAIAKFESVLKDHWRPKTQTVTYKGRTYVKP
jgi:hypothetical protein